MPKDVEWIRNGGRGLAKALAISLMLIFIFISPGISFELSDTSVTAGKNLIITGASEPNSENEFLSSFTMNLPVSSGKYSYETEVRVPNKPNRFAVTARNVQNLDAAVKMGIWITKSFDASGGVVYLSGDDIPPGRYRLKVSGTAIPGKSEVPITVEAETRALADSKGRYRLAIDTTGIPEGEYLIEGDGDAKTVRILSKNKPPSRASDSNEAEKETGADKDKNGVMPGAPASSVSEIEGDESVQNEVLAEEKATPQEESGQSKGVVDRLAEWLGL